MDHDEIGELVRHGLGVALMPRSLAGDAVCSLNPPLRREVWLIRRKGRSSQAARACREKLTEWSARAPAPE
ncbi:LysR substrate-binding domain-containing protein [Amycolatopsis sp.]|uniref:LysR substrate-binding domain-containing protein n=1 Tax=Amycolatopsis sp. TaxID=37632 RepID=UPI002C99F847|nr:LysR substrate-binding domain-containing protein [Amycolatopsis sp.]HVV10005.1 LysR substrate-binding domain-containing protein [Amycolatopsis sp.]